MKAYSVTARNGVEDGIVVMNKSRSQVRVGDRHGKGMARFVSVRGDFGRDIIWYEERGKDFGSLRYAGVRFTENGSPRLIPTDVDDGIALVHVAYYEPGNSVAYLANQYVDVLSSAYLRRRAHIDRKYYPVTITQMLVAMQPGADVRINIYHPCVVKPDLDHFTEVARLQWDGEELGLAKHGEPMILGDPSTVRHCEPTAEELVDDVIAGLVAQFEQLATSP